jgi:hypothetical protein
MTDNITPIGSQDPIEALEREAEKALTEEMNKTDKAKIQTSLRRIKDAERVVANLKLEHNALIRDLRATREVA